MESEEKCWGLMQAGWCRELDEEKTASKQILDWHLCHNLWWQRWRILLLGSWTLRLWLLRCSRAVACCQQAQQVRALLRLNR